MVGLNATAPAQPTLAGFDAPAAAQTSALLPRLAIMGPAAQRPQSHDTNDGAVVVDVLIAQRLEHHPRAVPVLASMRFGLGSYAENREAADRLVRIVDDDDEVVALGRGLEPGRWHAGDVLRLIHCDAITPTRCLTQE